MKKTIFAGLVMAAFLANNSYAMTEHAPVMESVEPQTPPRMFVAPENMTHDGRPITWAPKRKKVQESDPVSRRLFGPIETNTVGNAENQ